MKCMHAEWKPMKTGRKSKYCGESREEGVGHEEVRGVHCVCAAGKWVGGGDIGGICLLFNLPSVRRTTARVPNQAIHHTPIETLSIIRRPEADSGPHAIQKSCCLLMHHCVGFFDIQLVSTVADSESLWLQLVVLHCFFLYSYIFNHCC